MLWKSTIPFIIMCQLPWICILLWHGWPRVPMTDLEPRVFLMISVSTTVVSNVPDLASIVIYLKMVCHFRGHQNSVHPLEHIGGKENTSSDSPDFRGIWVGEEMGATDSTGNNSLQEQNPPSSPSQSPAPVPEPAVVPAPAPTTTPPPQSVPLNEAEPGHDVSTVMKVLRWHVCLCLSDASFAVGFVFVCSPVGKAVYHITNIFLGAWVPILVIKNNFRQLDSIGISNLFDLFQN